MLTYACTRSNYSHYSLVHITFCSSWKHTVQVRDKRPTHTQNARTIFAQTRVEKRVLKQAFARI